MSSGVSGLCSPPPLHAGRLPPRLRRGHVEAVEVDPRPRLNVDEVGHVNLEPARDGEEHVDRRIPFPPLNLRKIPEGQADAVGGVGLGPPEPPARSLDPSGNSLPESRGAHPQKRRLCASLT